MRPRIRRLSVFLAALLALSVVGVGCHTPLVRTEAGSFEESAGPDRVGTEREGVAKQVLLYLPNRIVDAVDMVHVGVGLGLGLGPDIRITRWGQLALQAGAGVGVGYDDRSHLPAWANASATAAIGPFRGGGGVGNAPSVGDWEVGFAMPPGKVAVDLAEVVDFFLGWFFIDIQSDDYGRA